MSTQTAFAALLALVGVQRLVELGVSLRRLRAAPTAPVQEPALWPLMVLVHAGLVVVPPLEVVACARPFVPGVAAAAGAALVLATVLRVWTLRTIGRAWNVRVLTPDEAAVATTGPYAWVRHPNYLAVVLEVAALPLLHAAWLSAVALTALNALVLAWRIRTEERALARSPRWRAAMERRARLLPGVF